MKVRVFSGEQTKTEEVFVKLEQRGSDTVIVLACDNKGKPLPSGILFHISPRGILQCSCINREIGFELDDFGRLKVS